MHMLSCNPSAAATCQTCALQWVATIRAHLITHKPLLLPALPALPLLPMTCCFVTLLMSRIPHCCSCWHCDAGDIHGVVRLGTAVEQHCAPGWQHHVTARVSSTKQHLPALSRGEGLQQQQQQQQQLGGHTVRLVPSCGGNQQLQPSSPGNLVGVVGAGQCSSSLGTTFRQAGHLQAGVLLTHCWCCCCCCHGCRNSLRQESLLCLHALLQGVVDKRPALA